MDLKSLKNKIDFIIIGAEKSGTTYLKHTLRDHPEIYIPVKKELHFFDKQENFKKGYEWYESYFSDSGKKMIAGEISPGYLVNANICSQRIYEYNPEIKLIAVLRNPIERAWSNYKMNIAYGQFDTEFDEIINQNHQIITKGHYKEQLGYYLNKFRKDQLLILNYDLLKENSQAFLTTVQKFLGVQNIHISSKSDNMIASSKSPRFKNLYHLLRLGSRFFRLLGFTKRVKNIKTKYRDKIVKWNSKIDEENKTIPDKYVGRLLEIYQADIDFMEEYFGYKLDTWRRRKY